LDHVAEWMGAPEGCRPQGLAQRTERGWLREWDVRCPFPKEIRLGLELGWARESGLVAWPGRVAEADPHPACRPGPDKVGISDWDKFLPARRC
jgi:hypothetical protein